MTSLLTERRVLLTLVVIVLILSGLNPKHHGVWLLEVFPVLIGIPILIRTHDRFPLTPLAYRLMAGPAIILMIGAHYTYAEVPRVDGCKTPSACAQSLRSPRHLTVGFVPAIVMRELLLRAPLQRGLALLPGPRPASGSAPSMSFWKGPPRSYLTNPPPPFSPPRATNGIRSGICAWP
jgi:uncharacterized membrane protein YjdF